jgi:hypothetical protein
MIAGRLIRSFRQSPISVAWICAITGGAIALYHLRDFPWPHDFHSAVHAIVQLSPLTGREAIKLWTFWAWSGLLIAAILRKIEPQLDAFDACIAGAAGIWVLGYLMGSILGPIGLFRGTTVWLLMGFATVLLFHDIPLREIRRPGFGVGLVILALALASFSILPLQLTSPVLPWMDALCWPASVQKVLTFHVYLPFNNDPYGWWPPPVQTPGVELFYALLGLGSNIHLGVMAETAAMAPMAALIIVAAYRWAAALFNDGAGGAAALLLFLTTIFRRVISMRGSAVDLALVVIGLAFFLAPRRSRVLMAMGALMLGTAIPAHAVNGSFGIAVAMAAVVAFLIEGDVSRALAGTICLSGSILIGLPYFAIATQFVVPGAALTFLELAGIVVIIFGVSLLDRSVDESKLSAKGWPPLIGRIFLAAVTAAILYDLVERPGAMIYTEMWHNFPFLSLAATAGVLAILAGLRPASVVTMLVIGAALAPALVTDHFGWLIALIARQPAESFETYDLERKIAEYWLPFFLVFPAAGFFATLFEYLSPSIVIVAMFGMLLYSPPHAPGVDYDYTEHSIPINWMIDYSTTSEGYWGLTSDNRWTLGPAERQLIHLLYGEIAAGRINASTHILHLASDLRVYGHTSRFSVFTGINDDTVTFEPTADNWEPVLRGARVRPIGRLADALAIRPDYIVTQATAPAGIKPPPPGYEKLLDQGGFILYRRSGLPAGRPVRSIFPNWIELSIAFLIGVGAAILIKRVRSMPRS